MLDGACHLGNMNLLRPFGTVIYLFTSVLGRTVKEHRGLSLFYGKECSQSIFPRWLKHSMVKFLQVQSIRNLKHLIWV